MSDKENATKSLALINAEIKKELSDPAVARTLLATTFKGLEDTTMRQAILEGHLRGFTFKQFLEGDVYAIPFGKGYSLVTSIDYTRKIAQKMGVWKSKAEYEVEDGTVVSCTITAFRRIGQDVAQYPATAFMEEYNTERNLWLTKPKHMIAKVAESLAYRMACPEELAKTYTEEEFAKEQDVQPVNYEVKRVQEPYEQEEKPNMLLHQNKRNDGPSDEEIIDIEEQTK